MVIVCVSFKILFCLYIVWLFYIKVKYRGVLPPMFASLARDFVQLTLSLTPVIIFFSVTNFNSIQEFLENSHSIDFIQLSYFQQLKSKLDGLCVQFLFLKCIQPFKVNDSINWLFQAVGNTLINLFILYIITLPIIANFSFVLYYLFGSKVQWSSTVMAAIVTTFRSLCGINRTTHYYLDYPIQYTIIYVGIILFYFFIMFPISVALLLDAFSKTVIELGSVSDKKET